jgi:hypothetical protein
VARAQRPGAQKASAGLAPILEVPTGVRRGRRADRATGRSPLPGKETSTGIRERLTRPVHEMEGASWFLGTRLLRPGLAPGRRPHFGRRPFQSALSGSRVFKPPALPEVFDSGRGRLGGPAMPGEAFSSFDAISCSFLLGRGPRLLPSLSLGGPFVILNAGNHLRLRGRMNPPRSRPSAV